MIATPYIKCTFLVIDDSYIDRLVCSMLIKREFETTDVHEMTSARNAIEWLRAWNAPSPSSLVIMLDIMMPEMNGFEFLEHFDKLDTQVKDASTIFMLSSTLDDKDVARAETHPYVKKLLSKPLSAKELKSLLS